MHSAVQTAVVTIISYKPLSGLNFARYTEQYGSCMPSSPLGVCRPLRTHNLSIASGWGYYAAYLHMRNISLGAWLSFLLQKALPPRIYFR